MVLGGLEAATLDLVEVDLLLPECKPGGSLSLPCSSYASSRTIRRGGIYYSADNQKTVE